MIIGNNSNFNNQNNNFQNKMQAIKNSSENMQPNNQYNNQVKNHYTDINNKNAMLDKSFEMLQERLSQGLISLDEFHRQCNKLNKLRQK